MTHPEPEERRSIAITRHQAFPAVVALWFAVLLGLGSLVLPAVLLDRLVEISGLATMVPAAAPPLGFTARVLVALVAGLGGAALGLMLARRVADASDTRRPSRRARGAAATRSPLNVLDELDGEGVTNGHAPPLSRRRAAMMAEVEPLLVVPPAADSAPDQDEPLILSDLAAKAAVPPEAEPETTPALSTDEELSMTAEPSAFPRPHDTLVPLSAAGEERMRQVFTGPLPSEDEKAGNHPLPQEVADPASSAAEPAVPTEVAPEPASLRPVITDTTDEAAPPSWEEKPLDELGLVQLVQRLGSSLERRRAALAQAQAQAQASRQAVAVALSHVESVDEAPPPLEPQEQLEPLVPTVALPETGVEAARAEEAALARAAWFGSGPSVSAAAEATPADPVPDLTAKAPAAGLRPAFLSGLAAADLIAEDEDEDEEPFPDFNLPLRATAEGRSRVEDERGGEGADRYRSLLAVNGSGSAEKKLVRLPADESAPRPSRLFDAPGSRPFGKQGSAGAQQAAEAEAPAVDTDAALRAALATLQRMSGPA
jgi:hypothetical protein